MNALVHACQYSDDTLASGLIGFASKWHKLMQIRMATATTTTTKRTGYKRKTRRTWTKKKRRKNRVLFAVARSHEFHFWWRQETGAKFFGYLTISNCIVKANSRHTMAVCSAYIQANQPTLYSMEFCLTAWRARHQQRVVNKSVHKIIYWRAEINRRQFINKPNECTYISHTHTPHTPTGIRPCLGKYEQYDRNWLLTIFAWYACVAFVFCVAPSHFSFNAWIWTLCGL